MKDFTVRAARFAVLALLGLVGALCIAGALYRPDLRIPAGSAGAYVDVEGVPLRVLRQGSGRDVLLIHGSPGLLEDFDTQAAELESELRVTRYDRPGHGLSGDGGSYSAAYNARIASALIEKLGLERTIVVGHSYGGVTALALAEMRSPRVAAIVVLDSAVYAPIRPINPLFRFLRLPAFGLGLARLLPRSVAAARIEQSIAEEFKAAPPPHGFNPPRIAAFSDPKVLHATANEHWHSAAELARQSPHYGEIDLPVYFVAQRDDPARRAAAERLQREVAGAEVVLVSPSGHYVQIEQPGAVNDVIRRAAGLQAPKR